ncbi:alanyl-tRNA editing protein [Vibrio sp. 99-70-13A1]|uniref:alanyl-tRNA editing protein n=1 Tax=Vibrio sp. 99-70-13A1 TaxID=2607601 RepID=UPI001493966D|nr:alanyl-tRNA editing protein [Vibrio sp. 99-70-13A1]NOH98074.1 alanyl-tRNA editing protein [Vibrio sp. 99-70-13A1]
MTNTKAVPPTKIKFCHNTWVLEAVVQLVEKNEGRIYIVTDETPFHPVSHIWPDHPADRGTIQFKNTLCPVEDCLVGAFEEATGLLFVGSDIPVKRNAEGWSFVVVHQLSEEASSPEVGDMIQLNVDQDYQMSLSRGHSAGHIAFLALNKILSESYWRKDADRKDALGSYDFNSYAQVTSFVTPDTCIDKYRLGKTLKKRGLNVADMLSNLKDIESNTNQLITKWLTTPAEVTMRLEGETLTDSRYWECLIDGDAVSIPCGGSHINSIKELQQVTVTLSIFDEQHIEMRTDVNSTC